MLQPIYKPKVGKMKGWAKFTVESFDKSKTLMAAVAATIRDMVCFGIATQKCLTNSNTRGATLLDLFGG